MKRRLLIALCACVVGFWSVPASAAAGGTLDPGFGTGGRVTTVFPNGSYANAVAVATDGTIVAVGAAAGPSNNGEFAVARYLSDGSPDLTFSGNGRLTTAIAGGGDEAASVAIQPDGKIVVAGNDNRQRFAVVRYMPGGSRDQSFGRHGVVLTNLTPGQDLGYDVAIQDNGKIVVVGTQGTGSAFAIVRYLSNGDLDPAFGGDGTRSIVRGGVARAVVLQPDGRILVTGYDGTGLVLARLRVNGSLDPTFAGDGIASGVAWAIFPLTLALQSNGKIVVGGDYDIFHAGLARFTSAGRLDPTFGGNGIQVYRFGSGEQNFTSIAIQPNGRIVGAGHVGPHEFGDTTIPRMFVGRILPDGSLDPSWGNDGKVFTRFPGGASAEGLALQDDGRVVVAGNGGTGPTWGFALARYLP